MKDGRNERLSAEWLPDPTGPAEGGDDAEWERRLQRLMVSAEPALAELARTAAAERAPQRPDVSPPWWRALALYWKPALTATAAATAGLVLVLRFAPASITPAEPSPATFALTAVASDGDAAALWRGMGADADPVLAQLVLDGGEQ